MKAMLLAAGLGTRLKPFTDLHPKALLPVNGKSLLQRNIEYLASFGITEVIVNVHHFHEQIITEIKNFGGWGSAVSISNEQDEVLETGGGLKKASEFFMQSDDPFVLMNADILTDLDLKSMLEAHRIGNVLATLAVTRRQTSRYLLFNNEDCLCGWTNIKTGEKKGREGTKKAFSGIHILSPKVFSLITREGKFSMIDLYLSLCDTEKIKAFDHSLSKFIDVGKTDSVAMAENLFP